MGVNKAGEAVASNELILRELVSAHLIERVVEAVF